MKRNITNLHVVGPYNESRSTDVSPQISINLYPDINLSNQKLFLRNTPGSVLSREVDTGSSTHTGRPGGSRVFDGVLYKVLGDKFYSFNSNLVPTLRGTLNTSTGGVSMASSGTQIGITDGTDLWAYTPLSGTFVQVLTPGLPPNPDSIIYKGTYFILLSKNSKIIALSGNNDIFAWDILDRVAFESESDNVVRITSIHQRVLFLGVYSTESWYITPQTNAPLARDNNFLFEYGIFSPNSLVKAQGPGGYAAVFWLSGNSSGPSSVMMTDGGVPIKASNASIDFVIQELSHQFDISDMVGMDYVEDGHLFYVMTSKNANTTLVYDVNTREWHKRTSHSGGYHPMVSISFFNNRQYFSSFNDSNIYELSLDYFLDVGETIIRERVFSPNLSGLPYGYITINEVELHFQAGVGISQLPSLIQNQTPVVLGSIPTIRLSVSRDGGTSFGNEHRISIGAIGRRDHRCRHRLLGRVQSNRLVFKISMSDPVPYFLMGGIMHYGILS